MYRIHFTAEDVARTRVARKPSPLLDLNIALRLLQEPAHHPVRLGAWRRATLPRLGPAGRALLDVAPPFGDAPAFLFRSEPGDLVDHLEEIRATPARRVVEQMSALAADRKIPAWARRLDGSAQVMTRLADAVHDTYLIVLGPYLARINAQTSSDVASRSQDLLDGGIERLLTNLFPRRIRWSWPVLEIAMESGMEADLHLDGQGLLLMPSAISFGTPFLDEEAVPQPILVYPVRDDSGELLLPPATSSHHSLAQLIGRTRAAVLTVVATMPGLTTTEIASHLRISPASASEHATVLRAAGLIATLRQRNTAMHSITDVGQGLVERSQH